MLSLGGIELRYGAFLTSVINFLIMALVLFCLLKAVNKLLSIGKKPEAPAAPTTKKCPFCCSEIPIAAVKCAHCASDLPKDEKIKSYLLDRPSGRFFFYACPPMSRRSTIVPSCAEQTATRGAISPEAVRHVTFSVAAQGTNGRSAFPCG